MLNPAKTRETAPEHKDGQDMWFLIKGTFWFSLVLVLLPFLDPSSNDVLERGPKVDVGETVSAASEAIGYISAMCSEKPDVCIKGAETFVALGHRAREGAKIAFGFLDTQFAEPSDGVMAGTVTVTPAGPAANVDEEATAPVEAAALAEHASADDVPAFTRIPVPEKRIEPKHTAIR